MNGFKRGGINCCKILNFSKCTTNNNYTFYRYARGNRLKLLRPVADFEKLDRILYNYDQQQNLGKLKDSELYGDNKSDVIEEKLTPQFKAKISRIKEVSSTSAKDVEEKKHPPVNEITEENQYEWLAGKVTPYHSVPYQDQLEKKFKQNTRILKEFGQKLIERGGKIPEESKNMPCMLDYTIASPITEAYRNKDEFSIRTGLDGNPKTVGFFVTNANKNMDTFCIPPDHLIILKESHKLVAKEFENYIEESSYPACHDISDGGHWRNIIVRSNIDGDIMAVVIFNPQQLSKEAIEDEIQRIKEYFYRRKEALNIKSFYFQACPHVKCTHAQAPFQLLFGEQYIFETVNGIKFRLSPEAFFQINTSAASVLYKLILNTCKVNKSTTILDICCGVGPISLTFAPHVKNCIGIDTSVEAIEDAKYNAEINGIENVEFHAGKSEYILRDILNEIYAHELIAIINPARSALGNKAMFTLRECKYLKKVLFVSCNPVAAIPNFVELCRPSGANMDDLIRGARFYPFRAVPVDLFPHTKHCELVILFQRL